jgi:hypothetical protein
MGTPRSQNALRMRKSGGEEGDSGEDSSDSNSEPHLKDRSDPIFMFGGLAPPALRRSKEDFSAALDHYIAAANLIHRISIVQSSLAPDESAVTNKDDFQGTNEPQVVAEKLST